MDTIRKTHWLLLHLHCLLVGSLVDSSAHTKSIISKVGNQVVLPCSWKSHQMEMAPSDCHIQWTNLASRVFELFGERKWQAEQFKDRVEVNVEGLESGNCSLIIHDVQVRDTGSYDSYIVVDGVRSRKTRVFIQNVRLSVIDHKSTEARAPGENLLLDLYTHHSMRVVFYGRNSSQWSTVWMRGDKDSERVAKHPVNEQLTIKNLTSSDAGTYKVLDEHGLSVSTVQLTVEGKSMVLKFSQIPETQARTDDAARSSSSALLVLSVLVTCFQVLRLL